MEPGVRRNASRLAEYLLVSVSARAADGRAPARQRADDSTEVGARTREGRAVTHVKYRATAHAHASNLSGKLESLLFRFPAEHNQN